MEIWKPITVTNVPQVPQPIDALRVWNPVLGREFSSFVAPPMPQDQQDRLRAETLRILRTCVDPSESLTKPRANAGLVLGYVQSGKTSSFTAAAALARDNNYDLIIVIAGVNTILTNQTYSRLQKDLGLDRPDVVNRWTKVLNPKIGKDPAVQHIQTQILTRAQTRQAGNMPIGAVPLVVVMKSTSHLKNLNAILQGLKETNDLRGLTALVIDDECHMATPNVAKQQDDVTQLSKSRIYELISELRSYLPHHTLLQYTATPQANLLCALEDEFRAEFVRLLGHGPGYAGGRAFFVDPPKAQSIRQIPLNEQAAAYAANGNDESVPTLRRAFATFLILAANDRLEKIQNGTHDFERFSMLVHSSSGLQMHLVFQQWLTSLRGTWQTLIQGPLNSIDRQQLRVDEFEPAYLDLAKTATQPLCALDDLYGSPIVDVLQLVHLWLVNGDKKSGGTSHPDFNISNYNVLNGGEILGVGFTIPRLHVTHLLRNEGQGQMDTIQQRGRFFGYCGAWLDRTRVWLEDEVKEAFEGYVDEEDFLRRDLRDYDELDKNLKGWSVRLRLNPNAKPCRRAAIRRELQRFSTDSGWVQQQYYLSDDQSQVANRQLLQDFLAGQGVFSQIGSSPIGLTKANSQYLGSEWSTQHLEGTCQLDAIKILLSSFVVNPRDRARFDVLFETIEEVVSLPNVHQGASPGVGDVFVMAGLSLPQRRRRAIGAGEPRVDLFQGRNDNYVGDRGVHSSRLTLQIHNLDHGPSDKDITKKDIPYLAVWLPPTAQAWAENWVQEK